MSQRHQSGPDTWNQTSEAREQQAHLASAAQDAARLAWVRYESGFTAYLEVLTNETNAYDAELALTQAQLNELLELVQIYKTSAEVGSREDTGSK